MSDTFLYQQLTVVVLKVLLSHVLQYYSTPQIQYTTMVLFLQDIVICELDTNYVTFDIIIQSTMSSISDPPRNALTSLPITAMDCCSTLHSDTSNGLTPKSYTFHFCSIYLVLSC